MRNKTAVLLSMLPAVLTVAAAGCGSSHKPSAATTSTSTITTISTSTTASSGSTSSTAGSSTSSSSTAPSGPAACATSHLSGSLGAPNGAAGTIYYMLQLTNTGSSTCTLYGYPGVSFVTGSSGTQVGAAADHNPGTLAAVSLAPGASAHAVLGITAASNFGPDCDITNVAGLRVYPPGQTTALFIPHTDQGCTNTTDVVLHVGPLAAG